MQMLKCEKFSFLSSPTNMTGVYANAKSEKPWYLSSPTNPIPLTYVPRLLSQNARSVILVPERSLHSHPEKPSMNEVHTGKNSHRWKCYVQPLEIYFMIFSSNDRKTHPPPWIMQLQKLSSLYVYGLLYFLHDTIYTEPVVRAIEVSHTACKDQFLDLVLDPAAAVVF